MSVQALSESAFMLVYFLLRALLWYQDSEGMLVDCCGASIFSKNDNNSYDTTIISKLCSVFQNLLWTQFYSNCNNATVLYLFVLAICFTFWHQHYNNVLGYIIYLCLVWMMEHINIFLMNIMYTSATKPYNLFFLLPDFHIKTSLCFLLCCHCFWFICCGFIPYLLVHVSPKYFCS